MLKFFVKRINNKKGFTLVELVVVVAILGVLAAVAVPKLSSSRTEAADAAHAANKRTLESAAAMCLAKEGTPSTTVTWPSESSAATHKSTDYLQSWPPAPTGTSTTADNNNAYKLTISTDGTILVTNESSGG